MFCTLDLYTIGKRRGRSVDRIPLPLKSQALVHSVFSVLRVNIFVFAIVWTICTNLDRVRRLKFRFLGSST